MRNFSVFLFGMNWPPYIKGANRQDDHAKDFYKISKLWSSQIKKVNQLIGEIKKLYYYYYIVYIII